LNNNNNETIVDLKYKRIGNEMNTITLSRIDNNETIKNAYNNGKIEQLIIFFEPKILINVKTLNERLPSVLFKTKFLINLKF